VRPYPSAADLWCWTDSSFIGEEEFDDLYFRDFVTVGRRVARQSQASLTATPNQMAILSRGTDITMTKAWDMSLSDLVQYTSMVGTMLSEAMAVDREEVSPKLCHWGRGDLETSGNILGKFWALDHFSPNVSTNHILGTFRLRSQHVPNMYLPNNIQNVARNGSKIFL